MELKNPQFAAANLILGRIRSGVDLLGVKDGLNVVFTTPTPDKYLQTSEFGISVFRNGVKLREGAGNDFIAMESGGVGTGYDTVIMYGEPLISGEQLTADYIIDVIV